MKVPLRVFYDKSTGIIIEETGNFEDGFLVNYESIDEQIPKYKTLSERNRETFDYIELPFGAYAQDFAECNGYRVNPDTKELEFSYPDPNEPEQPPVYQKPLSEQIKTLELQQHQTNEDLSALMDFVISGGM